MTPARATRGLHLQHGLRPFAAAEDDQQVRDQFVTFAFRDFQTGFVQSIHGVAHDLHGALDNRLAGVDQRQSLLPHQHGLGDLRRVGQVVQSDVQHANARRIDRFLQFLMNCSVTSSLSFLRHGFVASADS